MLLVRCTRARGPVRGLTRGSGSHPGEAAGGRAARHRADEAGTVLDSREPFHYDAQRWGEYVQMSDSLFTFSHQLEAILEEEQ